MLVLGVSRRLAVLYPGAGRVYGFAGVLFRELQSRIDARGEDLNSRELNLCSGILKLPTKSI